MQKIMKSTAFILITSLLFTLTVATVEHPSEKNPHPQWCPYAVCHSNPSCQPCKRRYLFIIAQGRSGSTTLKNMINLLPGIRIRGEIGTSLFDMLKLFGSDNTIFHKNGGQFRNSFGHYDYRPNHMTCPAQSLMGAINPPKESDSFHDSDTIIGLKEIRIHTMEQVDFLLQHFPCSRFIFNIRSTGLEESQKKHFLYHKHTIANNGLIPALYNELKKKLGPKRLIQMDMSKWSESEGRAFTALSYWLGFKNCTFHSLIHDNVNGYAHVGADESLNLGKNCRLEL